MKHSHVDTIFNDNIVNPIKLITKDKVLMTSIAKSDNAEVHRLVVKHYSCVVADINKRGKSVNDYMTGLNHE